MIDTLVISGGGPTSLITFGIIQHLTKVDYINKENIKRIFGTSAGTMISVLFVLGINDNSITNYIINRPWHESISIGIDNLINFYDKKGLFDKEIIIMIFTPIFNAFNIDLNINLSDFYKIHPIELHFITFECNSFKTVDISYLNYPNLSIFDAILMSCAIPNLFQPVIIDGNCFIDGGLFANYPLEQCLNYPDINKDNILGFKNIYNSDLTKIDELTNIIDFMKLIVVRLVMANTKELNVKIPNEVLINMDYIDMQMFHTLITDSDFRSKLIKDGIKIAELYHDNICQKSLNITK